MYNRNFFATKLDRASLASIAAMTAMIALSTQMTLDAPMVGVATTIDQPAFTLELA